MPDDPKPESYTAFLGRRRIATGPLAEVAVAVKRASDATSTEPLLICNDSTGRVVDIDTRGTDAEIVARYTQPPLHPDEPRGRGRPKLGVIAREVTLLPRHWDWLSGQPGGASVALRKLVDEARRANTGKDRRRTTQEAAYRFMSAMAGNFPNFEEAIRALFAGDRDRFNGLIKDWPGDVRDYSSTLAFSDTEEESR